MVCLVGDSLWSTSDFSAMQLNAIRSPRSHKQGRKEIPAHSHQHQRCWVSSHQRLYRMRRRQPSPRQARLTKFPQRRLQTPPDTLRTREAPRANDHIEAQTVETLQSSPSREASIGWSASGSTGVPSERGHHIEVTGQSPLRRKNPPTPRWCKRRPAIMRSRLLAWRVLLRRCSPGVWLYPEFHSNLWRNSSRVAIGHSNVGLETAFFWVLVFKWF